MTWGLAPSRRRKHEEKIIMTRALIWTIGGGLVVAVPLTMMTVIRSESSSHDASAVSVLTELAIGRR